MRSPTPITKDPELRPDAKPVEVMKPETAQTLRELMIEVVTSGTGTAASAPGVQVAGKTGTAELGAKALEEGDELEQGEEPEQEVDAWFTGFAPAADPTLAVAAMVVNADGDGGVVAAPIVRRGDGGGPVGPTRARAGGTRPWPPTTTRTPPTTAISPPTVSVSCAIAGAGDRRQCTDRHQRPPAAPLLAPDRRGQHGGERDHGEAADHHGVGEQVDEDRDRGENGRQQDDA